MIARLFTIRGFAVIYSVMFAVLVAMNYMPFIYFDNGLIFGFFKLEPEANLLHLLSGIWALGAAWYSRAASLFYFRVFGTAYFIDGIVGIVFGKAYLNLRLFDVHAVPVADMMQRFVLNAPHIVIGGSAVIIGFYLARKLR